MKTLVELDAAAQEAAAKAAAARDAADRARAEAEARRQERLATYDQAQAQQFDRKQLEQDVTDAEHRLMAVIKADPVWAAIIDRGVAQLRLRHRWAEDGGGAGQAPPSVEAVAFEFLARIADREVHNLGEDELDARAAARTAAGESA